jgi:hypothetical protein
MSQLNCKKAAQLGMNPSTANAQLRKMLLYKFVVAAGLNGCHVCRKPMTFDTFSIEHKTAWLDSDDPVGNFFDLDNVGFSHLKCNVGRARKNLAPCGTRSAYVRGCRCAPCTTAEAAAQREKYTSERRRARYKRTGQ